MKEWKLGFREKIAIGEQGFRSGCIPVFCDDTIETIKVKYEWKPSCCCECHVFGYALENCPKRVVESAKETNVENEDGFTIVKSRKRKGKRADTVQARNFEGDKGVLALAPPHQGIDGEWSDGSGVIVYKWNDKTDQRNIGRSNWKNRWSCCAEYGENAPPCHQGWHVFFLGKGFPR
ncbi:hypothetical protein Tco_1108060 [Tanacetum coccineum]